MSRVEWFATAQLAFGRHISGAADVEVGMARGIGVELGLTDLLNLRPVLCRLFCDFECFPVHDYYDK